MLTSIQYDVNKLTIQTVRALRLGTSAAAASQNQNHYIRNVCPRDEHMELKQNIYIASGKVDFCRGRIKTNLLEEVCNFFNSHSRPIFSQTTEICNTK